MEKARANSRVWTAKAAIHSTIGRLAATGKFRRWSDRVDAVYAVPGADFLLVSNKDETREVFDMRQLVWFGERSGAIERVEIFEERERLLLHCGGNIQEVELRRIDDMEVLYRGDLVRLIPEQRPLFLQHTVGADWGVVRLETGERLGPEGFEIHPVYYEPGWPVMALQYFDVELARTAPPAEVYELSEGAKIGDFPSRIPFRCLTSPGCPVFVYPSGDREDEEGREVRLVEKPSSVLYALEGPVYQFGAVLHEKTWYALYVIRGDPVRAEVRIAVSGEKIGESVFGALPSGTAPLADGNGWRISFASEAAVVLYLEGGELKRRLAAPVDLVAESGPQIAAPSDLSKVAPPLRIANNLLESVSSPDTGVRIVPLRGSGFGSEDEESLVCDTGSGLVLWATDQKITGTARSPGPRSRYVLVFEDDIFADRDERETASFVVIDLKGARRTAFHTDDVGEDGIGRDTRERLMKNAVFRSEKHRDSHFLFLAGTAGDWLLWQGEGRSAEIVDLTTGKTAASLEHPVKGIRQRSRGDAGSDIVWELRNGHTEIWRAGNELAKLVDLGLAVEGATWFSERDWLLVWYGDGECGAIDLSWLESLRELEASGISFEGWRPLRDRLPLWTAGANPGEL